MIQSQATIERASPAVYDSFESAIVLRAADSAQYDDDAVMDSWLASMDPREFELILSRLAGTDARGAATLEFSA
jgi:hypothetical protein